MLLAETASASSCDQHDHVCLSDQTPWSALGCMLTHGMHVCRAGNNNSTSFRWSDATVSTICVLRCCCCCWCATGVLCCAVWLQVSALCVEEGSAAQARQGWGTVRGQIRGESATHFAAAWPMGTHACTQTPGWGIAHADSLPAPACLPAPL